MYYLKNTIDAWLQSSYKFKPAEDDPATMTDRQFLKSQWSSGWAWYKKQPLDQIRWA